MGKSALASHVFEELKAKCKSESIEATFAKSTSTETEQRIPLRCVKMMFGRCSQTAKLIQCSIFL
jgi:hypothetical protein